jgi:hypothetical protein
VVRPLGFEPRTCGLGVSPKSCRTLPDDPSEAGEQGILLGPSLTVPHKGPRRWDARWDERSVEVGVHQSRRGLPRNSVTSYLWCREVPLGTFHHVHFPCAGSSMRMSAPARGATGPEHSTRSKSVSLDDSASPSTHGPENHRFCACFAALRDFARGDVLGDEDSSSSNLSVFEVGDGLARLIEGIRSDVMLELP